MELREFAEQVLFSRSLAEKLRIPDAVTDERPGAPLVVPPAPGRPPELQFKGAASAGADFPGEQRLEDAADRGRLLHFFANHELLATELMALVLLRFPDAPQAFRRGVFQTLKEEQRHTQLYLERMRACGVAFGEIPVSGYFWRVVSPMQSPLDYVSSLSLTFEQANLDFCRHFAQAFARCGDSATAELLERIYRDEIAHVAYGLKWFRRWKNPALSDWDAFCRQLQFPLSPQRAKGISLNVEGRRAAGLDAAFIAELNVYAQSKGRTPAVFVFNPFCEGYFAHGPSFSPVRSQKALQHDLETLPQFLCRQDDIVLVAERPRVEFLSEIKDAGFHLPEFVVIDGGRIEPASELARRKIGRLRPWAWGPDSWRLLEALVPNVTGDRRDVRIDFHPGRATLYSKAWSAALLRRLLPQWHQYSWLCTEQEAGIPATTSPEAFSAIERIRETGHHRVVVKAALGLAGQNAIRLWEPALLESQRRWIRGMIDRGQTLVVEPWLARELDFSIQLEMKEGGLGLLGYVGLNVDHRGQYLGNWARADFGRRPPLRLSLADEGDGNWKRQFQEMVRDLIARLEEDLRAVAYAGPVGIDAFVFRAADGQARIKPIVEINPRYTMGRLTLELMHHVSPGSCGRFRLINAASLAREGHATFASLADSLCARSERQFKGEPIAKIVQGAFALNDPIRAEACLAVFEVDRDAPALASFTSRPNAADR